MQINNLDKTTQYKDSLESNGFLRINNFLTPDFADKIYECLLNGVNWGLAYREDGESITKLNTETIKDLPGISQEKISKQLCEDFQFIYNTYMIVTSYLEQRDPGHYLYTVLEWLNSQHTLSFFRELTGKSELIKINAQATRYMPGHFLKQHNDENSDEGRMYAYVMGFSKDWNPDWGGLLHILDDEGEIVKTMIPEFNSLSIFEVPQNHFVSYVSPFAENQRLAITGWLLKK